MVPKNLLGKPFSHNSLQKIALQGFFPNAQTSQALPGPLCGSCLLLFVGTWPVLSFASALDAVDKATIAAATLSSVAVADASSGAVVSVAC